MRVTPTCAFGHIDAICRRAKLEAQAEAPSALARLPESRRALGLLQGWWEGWSSTYRLSFAGYLERQDKGNSDGLVVEGGGLKAELANRRENGLIQACIRGLGDLDIGGPAGFVDLEIQDDFHLMKGRDVRGHGRQFNRDGREDLRGLYAGRNQGWGSNIGRGRACDCSCGEKQGGEQDACDENTTHIVPPLI